MRIADFTTNELDLFRERCNFSDTELECFNMKAKDMTDVAIAMNLGLSGSAIAAKKRKIRSKIVSVLKEEAKEIKDSEDNSCGRCCGTIGHTVKEWAKMPDEISRKGVWYAYTDYRTETRIIDGKKVAIDVARFKYGDGKTLISQLPFVTAAITDEDIEDWDNQLENDFGKPLILKGTYVFPSDGYLMLEFGSSKEYARVKIFGAGGKTFFIFEKRSGVDIHSKEVFVKRGMKCECMSISNKARVKFMPLV